MMRLHFFLILVLLLLINPCSKGQNAISGSNFAERFNAIPVSSEQGNTMKVREPNFVSFEKEKSVTEVLGKTALNELNVISTDSEKNHPEYGQIPYKTQCEECVELVGKRTVDSRYFIKSGKNGQTFYVQKSSGQLHYNDENGYLRTIDHRLRQHPNLTNVYYAPYQELPTKLDISTGHTSIELLNGYEFIFNSNLKIYHIDGNQTTNLGSIGVGSMTIGSDGSYTTDAWSGIDRTMEFGRGEIKTNYILKTQPLLPSAEGWLIFEDEITLLDGYDVVKDQINGGTTTPEGYWQGNLLILDQHGEALVSWRRPIIYDSNRNEKKHKEDIIAYDIVKNNNIYFIRVLVKAAWLMDAARVYPVIVDPLVSGSNTYSTGDIGFSKYAPGNGFCGSSSNYCQAKLTVVCPGNSQVTNVIFDHEYFAVGLGCPAWDCWMSHGGVRFVGPCGESPVDPNYWWSCASPLGDATGTCSGAGISVPQLANCLVSCPDHVIDFYLRSIDCNSPCFLGNCATSCLYTINNSWTMTVEAMTVESNSTANGTPTTFIGSCNVPYTINANPQYGVPVYSYNWSTGQTVQSFVDVQSANGTYTYTCTVTDACGQTSVSTVQVIINDCPLPVELISFTGQNKDEHNLLKWTTGSEINSDYFEIQKSENGFDFQTIGTAKGAGNSNREINYEFRDYDPFAGLNYYRLKQVDFNGEVNWSNVITVKVKGSFDLGVYPNPTKDEVTVSFEYNQSSPGEIRIIDMMGRTVYAAGLSAQKGQNNLLLDLSQHSKGLYFITITVEKEVYKAMVMKER